jgi:hypothetical protein
MNLLSGPDKPKRDGARGLRILGLAIASSVVLAIAVVYAYATAFSYFASYDDVGYAMITVRGFLEGHRLYLDVFTYYGPFYFFYEWFVHSVLTIPLTHDATTALCVVHWLIGSTILALAGFLLTRSLLVACLVFMQATLHLTPLAREPGHPQELVVLLLCAALAIGASARPPKRILLVLAAISAALLFTKINIGVFYGCSLLLLLAGRAAFFKSHRVCFFVTLALSALLPFLLMRPNLREGWALMFSMQSCAAILATGAVAYVFGPAEKSGVVPLLQAGCIFAACLGLFMLAVLLKGTSLPLMVDALVTQPAKLGTSFSIPLRAEYGFLSAGLALVSAAVVIAFRERNERLRLLISTAKGVFGVIGTMAMVTDYNRELCYLLPWSWLVMVQVQNEGGKAQDASAGSFGRTFLCLLAIWQSLQAYPVAGTQAAIGTLLLPVIYAVCLHDAFKGLSHEDWAREWLNRMAPRTRALAQKLAFAGLLYLFTNEWCMPLASWRYYMSVPPLGLKGAEHLRLPYEQAEPCRAVTQFLQAEGDAFHTLPGFSSLYFWTGKAPPTYLNTSERLVLNESQQKQVIAALKKAKHPLIVLHDEGAPIPESAGPLGALIHQQCREIKRFGMFRILELEPVPHPDQTQPAGGPPNPSRRLAE